MQVRDMTKGNPLRLILAVALPLMLITCFVGKLNLIFVQDSTCTDNHFISEFISKHFYVFGSFFITCFAI